MEPYLELAVWADIHLAKGEKQRILCPWCNGGNSKEKSLSVVHNEDGSLWWRCFRASCGSMGSRGASGLRSLRAKRADPRPFVGPLNNLSEAMYDFFNKTFGLERPSIERAGIRYAPEQDRFFFLCLSPSNKERGSVLRSFSGATPKTLVYRTAVTEPFIGWHKEGAVPRGPLVIVEDTLSGLKVHQAGGSACVLNGTYLNYQMATEISETWYEGDVYLALDVGTMQLMLKYKTKYDILIGPMKIWRLEADLKYESTESIRAGLFGGKTDFRGEAVSSIVERAQSV